MARVSQEVLDKLQAFIDALPVEARNKCALCNETLTHLVKTAEVETGAGTATVTRELANRINENAAAGDRVSDQALKQKVMRHEGVIGTNRTNNQQPKDIKDSCRHIMWNHGLDLWMCDLNPNLFSHEDPFLDCCEDCESYSPEECEQAKATTAHNHRAQGTGENEWYTPKEYIESARRVMGSIDMDPATSDQANSVVRASKFYTKEDNGLEQPWSGNIWLNPPYSQPAISEFANKMVEEWGSGNVESAIVLTHNYTDTRWFHALASSCNAICFTKGRIGFVNQQGEKAAPTQGQAFFFFGKDSRKFFNEFKSFGLVVEVLNG